MKVKALTVRSWLLRVGKTKAADSMANYNNQVILRAATPKNQRFFNFFRNRAFIYS